jgi:hypothetical protein
MKEIAPGPKAAVRIKFVCRAAAVVLSIAASAGCQTSRGHIVNHESDLAAAGFVQRPADTNERRALLARLPAHRFVQRNKDGKVHYVYADPSVCKCLYVGTDGAYSQYQQNKQSQKQVKELERDLQQHDNAAEDDDFNAQIYSDPAFNWEAWGPWGY